MILSVQFLAQIEFLVRADHFPAGLKTSSSCFFFAPTGPQFVLSCALLFYSWIGGASDKGLSIVQMGLSVMVS